MSIINYSFESSALSALRKQDELLSKLQGSDAFNNLAFFEQNRFAELMEPFTKQMEQYHHIWDTTFKTRYDEVLRPLQETLSAYTTLTENLISTTHVNKTLNMLHSEIYDNFKVPELLQLVSSKWEGFKYDIDLPKIDLFVDRTSNALTNYTAAMAVDLSSFSIDDFDYSIDEEGLIHLSEPLESIVTEAFDMTDAETPEKKKLFTREFFYGCVLPFLLMVMQLAFSVVQDNQQTELLKEHHQEQMAVYREILSEEGQQTDIAKKILEQEQQQTEYLKTIAEKTD